MGEEGGSWWGSWAWDESGALHSQEEEGRERPAARFYVVVPSQKKGVREGSS